MLDFQYNKTRTHIGIMNGLLGYETLEFTEEHDNTRKLTFNNGGPSQAIITITQHPDHVYVGIIEEDIAATFVASGNITFVDGDIYVNGVKNGLLTDKYDDCFVIKPLRYIHLLGMDHLISPENLLEEEDNLISPENFLEEEEESGYDTA